MYYRLHIVKAIMRKLRKTSHSFCHEPDFEEASLLLLIEPYASFNLVNLQVSVSL